MDVENRKNFSPDNAEYGPWMVVSRRRPPKSQGTSTVEKGDNSKSKPIPPKLGHNGHQEPNKKKSKLKDQTNSLNQVIHAQAPPNSRYSKLNGVVDEKSSPPQKESNCHHPAKKSSELKTPPISLDLTQCNSLSNSHEPISYQVPMVTMVSEGTHTQSNQIPKTQPVNVKGLPSAPTPKPNGRPPLLLQALGQDHLHERGSEHPPGTEPLSPREHQFSPLSGLEKHDSSPSRSRSGTISPPPSRPNGSRTEESTTERGSERSNVEVARSSRVRRGKAERVDRSRSPLRFSLGDHQTEKSHLQQRDPVSQDHSDTQVEDRSWKAFKFTRRGPRLSHLFFADDLILLATATTDNCQVINEVLSHFCECSGQKINLQKSKVFFSKNTPVDVRQNISTSINIPVTDSIDKYLGFPILDKKPKKAHCKLIVDKINAKLAGWKAKLLSPADRKVLISSSLTATASYYMQGMLLPASSLNAIDRACRNFLWGSSDNNKKMHNVKWELVTCHKQCGGLGLKAVRNLNEAFMAKLGWVVLKKDSALWCQLLRTKDFFYGPLPVHEINMPVAQVLSNDGDWVLSSISFNLPDFLSNSILAIPISKFNNSEDTLSWNNSKDGNFTIAQAYDISKGNPQPCPADWSWIWKTPVFPKVQHFLWLAHHGKLMTKARLFHPGISLSDICPVCNQVTETSDHIFRDCEFISQFWDRFSPIKPGDSNPRLCFKDWIRDNCSNSTPSGFHNIPWNIIFPLVLWDIWKNRNKRIFEPDSVLTLSIDHILHSAVEIFAARKMARGEAGSSGSQARDAGVSFPRLVRTNCTVSNFVGLNASDAVGFNAPDATGLNAQHVVNSF
ncbi:reverse transcriptase [Corchorus olitorius]|uniref:Reverse transcriptase n=1 Tax=Corchorus olitorius TaxID=93759 RepID=A0A1R3IZM2_9ROSI|nr:reverse transcriptase [Corchorus olitorius]